MSARVFSDEVAVAAIQDKNNRSVKAVLRVLRGSDKSGSNYDRIYSIVKKYELDTSHWLGKGINTLTKGNTRFPIEHWLVLNGPAISSHKLKLLLIQFGIKKWQCEECSNLEWNGKKIPIELDHINGCHTDNRIDNLRILCPNCHAQTPTYGTRNRKW